MVIVYKCFIYKGGIIHYALYMQFIVSMVTKIIRTILIHYRMQTLKVVQSIYISVWESFTERCQATSV
jgi:hypothetical protein